MARATRHSSLIPLGGNRSKHLAGLRANISGADHRSRTAGFYSPRLCRRDFAFPCCALPRRHCSAPSAALGRQLERVGDQLLGYFLSLIHVFAFLLGRLSVSIRLDWYGLWMHSWLARVGDYPLGKPVGRTFLHSQPLARTSRHVG